MVLDVLICIEEVRKANTQIFDRIGERVGNRIPNAVVYLSKNPNASLDKFRLELRKTQGINIYRDICDTLMNIVILIDDGVITEDTISAYSCEATGGQAGSRIATVESAANRLFETASCYLPGANPYGSEDDGQEAPDGEEVEEIIVESFVKYLGLERLAGLTRFLEQLGFVKEASGVNELIKKIHI